MTASLLLEEAGLYGQPDYQIFRKWYAEKKAPLVIVLGSGLSTPAGLPNWEGLKNTLEKQCESRISSLNKIADDMYGLRPKLEAAKNNINYWVKFKLYRDILSDATFTSVVRNALTPQADATIPAGYNHILKLAPRGVVTVNLDSFAASALTQSRPLSLQTPIFGKDIAKRWEAIQSADPFLVYLHGHIADSNSWVLDQDELSEIQASPGHAAFLQYIYFNCNVLFYGVSADDISISGRLIEGRNLGFTPQSVFWLTERVDQKLHSWATKNWIRLLQFKASPSHEAVLEAFVEDCIAYVPRDSVPPPIKKVNSFNVRTEYSPEEAALLAPDEIRKFLSDKISQEISACADDQKYSVFSQIARKYARAVHNSYYISDDPADDTWFDFKLISPSLGEGTFGQVFQANSSENETVAIKIMREAIHQKTDMLGAFRRGVRSMKIISDANLPGMIRIREAFELPPTIVMDYISGASLEQAVDSQADHPWLVKIKIVKDVASIVRRAHLLPDTVLHRDLKPSNIMLQNYDYSSVYMPEVVVVDFDMSWHKDSLERDVLFEARDDFAYLAPEQVSPKNIGLSRSTLVDSYGLGMTTYYLFGGEHPQINAYLSPEWPKEVIQAVRRGFGGKWKSAPNRLARLVTKCTQADQSARSDFGQIIGELEDIENAFNNIIEIRNRDLIAEEILAQIVGVDSYRWRSETRSAVFESLRGIEIITSSDDHRDRIVFSISWVDRGEVERNKISKYMEGAIAKTASTIINSPWGALSHSHGGNTLAISTSISIEDCRKNWAKAIATVDKIYKYFDFA